MLTRRYVLERRLGLGGAGVVWRAHDQVLGRAVAVKLLHGVLADDPTTAARFRAEAATAAGLTHPNAVIVFDIGQDRGRDYLVMELIGGPALSEVMAGGPLPSGDVAHIGRAVAAALGAAHRHGIVHRDVKPANILLTRDGTPKVADFGIARALGDGAGRLTVPNAVIGTARYLSPEQLSNGPIDGRADIYALGVLLHEALTGQPPWGDGTPAEIAARRLTYGLSAPSSLLPGIPGELDEVVLRATRRDPADRYQRGADLAAALEPFVPPGAADDLVRRFLPIPSRARPAGDPTAPGPHAVAQPTVATPSPDAPTRGHADHVADHVADRTARSTVDHVADRTARSTVDRATGRRPKGRRAAGSRAAGAARPSAHRRWRRGRGRRRLVVVLALFVMTIAVLGVTDIPLPAGGRVMDLVDLDGAAWRDRLRDLADSAERFLP